MVTFDSTLPGTPSAEWARMSGLASLPALDTSRIARLTVVAAHPDDETLGAGGLMADCAAHGIPIQVLVVTDGAASHPSSSAVSPTQLASIRQRELFAAISELAPEAEVRTLGFADGQTARDRAEIAAVLADVVEPGSTLVAPWRGDGHRDHRIVGEVCAELATARGVDLLEYPIWMWHWGEPDDERVPWEAAVAHRIQDSFRDSKRRAIARYGSQVIGVGTGGSDAAVLTPDFLSHFDSDREVFLQTRGG